MKCQILIYGKNKKNISICHMLQILPRALTKMVKESVMVIKIDFSPGQFLRTLLYGRPV